MAKQIMQKARQEYEAQILDKLDAYRDEIEARKSGYLRSIQTSLKLIEEIDCPYVFLSLLVKKYRQKHDIPMHNRRADRRAKQAGVAQNAVPTE
jgi:hypothetical protein